MLTGGASFMHLHQLYMFYFTAGGNQSQPFMHSVQSPMLSGGASHFEGDGEDDDQPTNIYGFSQTVFHTPPPPSTQETQTVTDEVNYGHGYREPHPPPHRLSPSGPRPRKTQTRRCPPQWYAYLSMYDSLSMLVSDYSQLCVSIYVWDMLHVHVSGDIYCFMYARDILLLICILILVTFSKRLQSIIKIQVHLN